MPNKTEELAQTIMRKATERTLNENEVLFLIQSHWKEASNVISNIESTSIGDNDRATRLQVFEERFGLSIEYII